MSYPARAEGLGKYEYIVKWNHHHQVVLITRISLNLSRHPSLSSITLCSSIVGIQCPPRADNYKSLLVGGSMLEWELTTVCDLWVHSCFSSSAQYALLVLIRWFVRWEASGCTAVALLGAPFRIYSKQHKVFLCSSDLTVAERKNFKLLFSAGIVLAVEVSNLYISFNENDWCHS